MADATTPSNWILDGRDEYPEFKEATTIDSAGDVTEEFIIKRNVYQFRRYRIEPNVSTGGSLPDGQIGDTLVAAALSAYQGTQEIDAGVIHTGETRKYVCISDNFQTPGVGASWLERHQVWEMRGPYAPYVWPE